MALNLFGVTVNDIHRDATPLVGTQLIAVRDLAAIVAEGQYAAVEPTDARVDLVSTIISRYAARGAVLPAPVGVVFRSRDSVLRWLELHYVALSDALNYVDDRVVGRVHVTRPQSSEGRAVNTDVATVAAETLRALRGAAVATVPLRMEQMTGVVLSAAFLVEQENWKVFAARVEEQGSRAPELSLELTGPWPPYDFVQMQFES